MEKHNGETGQQAEESRRTEKEKMRRYRIREGSFLDWFVSIAAPIAVVLFIGFGTGIVDYI